MALLRWLALPAIVGVILVGFSLVGGEDEPLVAKLAHAQQRISEREQAAAAATPAQPLVPTPTPTTSDPIATATDPAVPTATPPLADTSTSVPTETPTPTEPSFTATASEPTDTQTPTSTAIGTPTTTGSPVAPSDLPPLSAKPDAPGVARAATIGASGGRISSPDGRVIIDVPGGAATGPLSVQIKRRENHEVSAPSPDRPIVGFWDFTASALDRGGAPVHVFSKNLTVTLQFSPEELRGFDPAALLYWSLDTDTGKWTNVPGDVDLLTRTLTVNVGHFSGGAATDQKIVDTAPLLDGHNVNLQTGSAALSVPVDVPPGRNGLAPQLALSYDSSRVEEMRQYSSLSGWTGMGWDLGTGSVQISNDPSGTRYFLEGQGFGGEMMQDTTVDAGSTFRLRDERYARIQSDCGLVAFGTDTPTRQISVETSAGIWSSPISVGGITNTDPHVHPIDEQLWFATNDSLGGNSGWGWGAGARSTDGGASWSATTDPGIGGGGIVDVAQDAGGRIWALTHTVDQVYTVTSAYYSDNGGNSWTLATTHGGGPSSFQASRGWKILTSPTDPNTLAIIGFSGNMPSPGNSKGYILYTHDRGSTWGVNYSGSTTQGQAGRFYDATMLPSGRIVADGPFIVQAPVHWYAKYSDDFGATWNTSYDLNDSFGRVNGLFVDQSGARVGFIATTHHTDGSPVYQHRLLLSSDSGSTFTQVTLSQELDQYVGTEFTFDTFAASAATDSIYIHTGADYGAKRVLRLSPVSASGTWSDLTGNYPLAQQGFDSIAVSPAAQCPFTDTDMHGTRYVYGSDDAHRRWYLEYNGSRWVRRYYRLDLSYVVDVMGNRVDYAYWQQLVYDPTCGSAAYCQYVLSAYPQDIYYNYNGTQPQANIHFDLAYDNDNGALGRTPAVLVRNDDPYNVTCGGATYTAPKVMETRRLSSIKTNVYSGGVWKLARQYDLNMTSGAFSWSGCNPIQPFSGTNLLNGITVKGSNASTALSVMNLTYTAAGDAACLPVLGSPNGCHNSYRDGASGSDGYGTGHDIWGYDWPHLKQATNGFGGTTNFVYTFQDNHCSCQHWTHSAVTQSTSSPGMAQPTIVTSYGYTGPYEWDYPNPLQPATADPFNAENLGYGTATEIDASANKTLHSYYVGATWNDEIRRGREYDTVVQDSGGNHWKEVVTTWAIRSVAGLNSGAYYVNFVAPAQTDTYLRDGTHLVSKSVYDGDTTGTACPPGNTTCFGLRTAADDLGDVDAGGNTRGARVITNTAYNINKPAWVFTPQYTEKVDPVSGNAILSSTSYYYDGSTSRTPATAPARGLLTATSGRIDASNYTNAFTIFDAYGNPVQQSMPTGTRPESTSCGNALGCIPSGLGSTTTAYDANYHIFPTSLTNPAGQQTTYEYTDATNGDFVLGKATKVTEPTGHISQLLLDVFGRTTQTWDDFDSQTTPTVLYTYVWGAARTNATDPNRTFVQQRTTSGTSNVHKSVSCMDGFGREVLSGDQYNSVVGNRVRTDYDARGLTAAVGNPQFWSTSIGGCPATLPAITTVDRTAYSYDPLGAVSGTTALAVGASTGPRTQSVSNGVTSTTIDENFRRTVQARDIGNKTLTVTEPLASTILRPTGQGAYSEWVASPATSPATAHYLNVKEASSDDDATQINQQSWGARDTQTYAGAGLPDGTSISAVILHFRWKHYDSYTPNPALGMWTMFRQSGTDVQGPQYHRTNTDGWGDDDWQMSTNPRTGAAWTLAEVNAGLEFGFKVSPAGGSRPYVSQAWIEIVTQAPSSAQTTYHYDLLGRLVQVNDATASGGVGGNQTTFSYDMAGRKTAMTDPDMGSTSYNYNALGQVTSQTDARSITGTFTHNIDALGRLTQKSYSNGNPSTAAYTYDAYDTGAGAPTCPHPGATAIGHLVKVADAAGTQWSCFDKRGREELTARKIGTTTYTISRVFDDLDQVISMTYPDGEIVTYGESGQGDINSLTAGSTTLASSIASKPWHDVDSIVLGSGQTTQYGFDYRLRLNSIVTGSVQNLTLGYDDASNVTSVTDNITPTESLTYSYDQLDRLVGMKVGATTAATYTYNAIGNLTSKVESMAGMSNTTSITSYTYPSSGSARPHAATATAGTPALSFTYDAAGNLATQGGGTYTYDAENHLSSRPLIGGGTMNYVYGEDGALAKRTNSSTGAWTVYIGGVYEVTNTGAITKYYSVRGHTIAMRQGAGTPIYLLSDQLGSSTTMTNSTGAVIATDRYWPFGGARLSTGTAPTDRLFTGQQQEPPGDNVLGLYDYGARFYSTVTGRFLSADPIAGSEGDPQSWNAYTYTRNSPVMYTDPTGMYPGEDLVDAVGDGLSYVGGEVVNGYDAVRSTPGATWDAVTGGVDLGMRAASATASGVADVAEACWGNDICQTAVVTAGIIGCSAVTEGAATAACVAAGTAVLAYGDTVDCATDHDLGSCARAGVTIGLGAFGATAALRSVEADAGLIVERIAQREAAGGPEYLKGFLSQKEWAAYLRNPAQGKMFLGQAVHRATDQALRSSYGERFKYFTRGPDFLDTTTNEFIELTTKGQEFEHMLRPSLRGLSYKSAFYELP